MLHQNKHLDETFGMTETGLPFKNQTSTNVNSILTCMGSCLETTSNISYFTHINITGW